MKISKKALLGILILALLVCFLVFRPWTGDPDLTDKFGPAPGPLFEVRVLKPRLARPLFGILPIKLEEKLESGGELRFDHTSRGARVGNVSLNHLELGADDWALFLETDGEGKIAPETSLVYTMMLAEKQRKLRCRPANPATGYLHATSQAGSEKLDGRFLVELTSCENVETGKLIEWPPAPLTVRGSFKALPRNER